MQTIKEMWEEHKHGLNGGTALIDLEVKHGVRWNNNKVGGAGRIFWNRRADTCLELENRMHDVPEKEAIDSLQLELDATVKNGRSKKPNIAHFNENLRKIRKLGEADV